MNQLLSIVDDGIVIKKLSVETLDGPVQATDDVRVQGNIFVERDIKARRNVEITGTLFVDTLKVKTLINEQDSATVEGVNPDIKFTFVGKGERSLEGQGLVWLDSETGSKQLVYKPGNKLWSNMNIDLLKGSSYQINQLPVLSFDELGPSVIRSNLRQVGELDGLKVSGEMVVDNWAFFNSYGNRLGLNTESPNGTLGVVVENGIEIIMGHRDEKTATLGTFTSNTLELITDNKARVSIKDTGEVLFGNPKFRNAIVKIHGRLEVDEIVTGNSDGNQLPLTFKQTESTSIFGTGILWVHPSGNRQLIHLGEPNRLYSTEIIDVQNGKWFSVDNSMVLSKTTLGTTVTESSLETLGLLRNLSVNGSADFMGTVNIANLNVTNFNSPNNFNVQIDGEDELKISGAGNIEIGHTEKTGRSILLHGQTVINGSLRIGNIRILQDTNAPSTGRWNKGDICYNSEPKMEGYIGWVCVTAGEPGHWCPFGLIMPVRS